MKKEQVNDLFIEERKPVDFKTVVLDYLVYWPLIVACLLVAIAGAYVYLRFRTPVYSVSSSVLIKQGDKAKTMPNIQSAAMQSLGTFSTASNFDNEVEILQSFTLIKKVVQSLNLYVDYEEKRHFGYAFPLYKDSPVQVWMSPEEAERLSAPLEVKVELSPEGKKTVTARYWTDDGEKRSISKSFSQSPCKFATPVGTVNVSVVSGRLTPEAVRQINAVKATVTAPSVVADRYKASLKAEPTSEFTSIVRLVCNDADIDRGVDFLNTLVSIYNDEANEDKNQVALRTVKFINDRIRVINEELGSTENRLAGYKQRAGLTDLSTDAQLALQGSSEYDQKRADNINQLHLINYLRGYIENPANKNEVIPANIGLTDEGLTNVITQYNNMIIERKRLLRTSKDNSPAIVNMDASIAAAYNTILATVESVEKGLQITRGNLNAEAGKYRARISSAPQQEKSLRDISRQQEIKANLYTMLLQEREENAITLAAKANNGRVVEEARVSGIVAPHSRNTYMIAILLGILFPVSGIWLSRKLRFRIEGRDDVQHITNAPIVCDIPKIKEAASGGIVVRENRNELADEVFRSLRTNVQYMLQKDQKVILFTSTISGEGKSFNAVNLAASFAFMEKKVVVVGLDIRNPTLSRIFGMKHKGQGITEFLASPSSTDLMQCCRQSEVSPNLYVLPCGTIPPNPSELVARPSLEQAMEILKEHFDYVILDTAPIGVVTDTRIVARVADLCVYVCRADYTPKSDFELINELVDDGNLPTFCVLVNGIDMEKHRYGYYYGYGRYAKYASYGHGKKFGHYAYSQGKTAKRQ